VTERHWTSLLRGSESARGSSDAVDVERCRPSGTCQLSNYLTIDIYSNRYYDSTASEECANSAVRTHGASIIRPALVRWRERLENQGEEIP
jgi:hypothetical protein